MKAITFFLPVLLFSACHRSKTPPLSLLQNDPDFDKAEALMSSNPDSSYYRFNQIVSNSKDSLRIAVALNYMGIIQADAGDYFGSQETLLSALKYLHQEKPEELYSLSSIYSELGSSTLKLKEYDAAQNYLDLALKFNKDESNKSKLLNNKALAYHKKHELIKAISFYNAAIASNKLNKRDYARTISNLANANWMLDSSYNAAPSFWKAMQIRKEDNDSWGLNASYAHLSDFYAKSRPDSALIYATKMHEVASSIHSPDDELEALGKLIILGPASTSQQYFERYQFLNDSIQTARNSSRNQFALIRYETEKSKAENLILQKDNTMKRFFIILIISGTALLSVFAILWYRKRKQQILKEQKLKLSQDVHDVVANGLYLLINQIEHNSYFDQEELLSRLGALYERSRDISYKPIALHSNTEERISNLITSFSSGNTRVSLAGNDAEIWRQLSPSTQKDLEFILQNIMINMQKHSQAHVVSVRFEQQQDQLLIHYRDDGIGNARQINFGNGLLSTENRIRSFGGRITFDNNEPRGLKILITIPI